MRRPLSNRFRAPALSHRERFRFRARLTLNLRGCPRLGEGTLTGTLIGTLAGIVRVPVAEEGSTGLADNAFLGRRPAGEARLELRRNRAPVRADVIDFSERTRLTAAAVIDPGAAVAPVATVPGHGDP